MAECFCGCGRTVPRFPLGIRIINKRGELVAQRLAWAEAHVNEEGKRIGEDVTVPGDETPWLDNGITVIEMLRTIVHGEPTEVTRHSDYGDELAARTKQALDATQAASKDWLDKGWAIEHIAVQVGATPIRKWRKL
jgi:hypothetical protein